MLAGKFDFRFGLHIFLQLGASKKTKHHQRLQTCVLVQVWQVLLKDFSTAGPFEKLQYFVQ